MEEERIKLENDILERLKGKILLTQDFTQKRSVIFQAFLEVYELPQYQDYIRRANLVDMKKFFDEFLSYGIIEEFLADPEVEDIIINDLSSIYIHKAKIGLVKTDKKFNSYQELDLFVKKLIIFSGRNKIKKINNVELSEIKGRANVVYSPFGPQITITRAKEKPLSIIDLIKNGTLNVEIASQFWLYIEGLRVRPANLIISGGPGTGKSTLLNALLSFVPYTERVVVIEDTLELNTDFMENCSRLESDDETTLADLVENSLRMRPDRIVVGEVRGKEAQGLMTAMNIGKYCIGTIHASTARETIIRLENEPMNIPEVLVNLIDVFVIMRGYIIDGIRKRVVAELSETAGMEKKVVLLSALCNFDLNHKKFIDSGVSSAYRDKLSLASGKTPKEIIEEKIRRAKILAALLERDITDIKEVTYWCNKYITNPKATMEELKII